MSTKAKDLDFEVNLLPVLSVLSICICFLLTTAIWSRMGFIGVNQAIGDELPGSGKNPNSIQMKVLASGQVILQLRSGEDSSILMEKKVAPLKSEINWAVATKEIEDFAKRAKAKTVIVMPEIGVNYGSAIKILDQLKGLSLNIGLAPAVKGVQ